MQNKVRRLETAAVQADVQEQLQLQERWCREVQAAGGYFAWYRRKIAAGEVRHTPGTVAVVDMYCAEQQNPAALSPLDEAMYLLTLTNSDGAAVEYGFAEDPDWAAAAADLQSFYLGSKWVDPTGKPETQRLAVELEDRLVEVTGRLLEECGSDANRSAHPGAAHGRGRGGVPGRSGRHHP